MFARKVSQGYQLFHDNGEAVVVMGKEGSGIYPVNNFDNDGSFEPKLLSAQYENSCGEAFIVTEEDFNKLGLEVE